MKRFLLDTSALLTLRDDEPGSDQVAEILASSHTGAVTCLGCFISLMEVFYRVWKDETEAAGRLAYERCLSLPMTWVHETPELSMEAAAVKAKNRLSLADAGVAACALLQGATLVHQDPEFESLSLQQLTLPYRV